MDFVSGNDLNSTSDLSQLNQIRSFFDPDNAPVSVHQVLLPELNDKEISLKLVRDDLLHPMISGNKWWKLKYALLHAAEEQIPNLVTFGGPYSNHILAVAAAGHLFGFQTIGIIRGDEPRSLNPALAQAKEWGMQLKVVSRDSYRQKNDPEYLVQLKSKWGPCLILPEGGTSPFAIRGTGEMVSRLKFPYDFLCCPVGTGGTMAGMVVRAKTNTEVIGFSALKNGSFLGVEVERLLQGYEVSNTRWSINTEFHFGGYARSDVALRSFCESFQSSQGVALDLVYTGKMLFGIIELVRRGFFDQGTRMVAWHTGNAQGIDCAKWGKYSRGFQ
jgi:1-aminocyclopropane-1-carboxylate deaminase